MSRTVSIHHILALLVAGLASAPLFSPAVQAAESYDNCSGYIDTVPTVITTQGVWCMRADVTTAISSGPAVTVQTNNVTIDCNDFKLGGLAAGTSSTAVGINSFTRLNTRIRNCNVRGFRLGIEFNGGSGLVVEESILDGNLYAGIRAHSGVSSLIVRNNTFYNTGGALSSGLYPQAMEVYGEGAVITGNVVNGVYADPVAYPNSFAAGIYVNSAGAVVADNHVSHVAANGTGTVYGIAALGTHSKAMRNTVSSLAAASANKTGIFCSAASGVAIGNVIGSAKPGSEFSNCVDGGGNVIVP